MKLMRIAAIAAALVLAGAGNWNTARAQSEPSPEAMAAARDLAGLISQDTIKDMATRLTAQIWPRIELALKAKQSITPAQADDLRKEFVRIEVEFISKVMADTPIIYARHFTAAELRELLAFYHTPLGQKSLKAMPEVTAEAMALVLPHMKDLQTQVLRAFVKAVKQRGFDI